VEYRDKPNQLECRKYVGGTLGTFATVWSGIVLSAFLVVGPVGRQASIELLFVTLFVEVQTRTCAEFRLEQVYRAVSAVTVWLPSSVD
jgi:hypothetical protein